MIYLVRHGQTDWNVQHKIQGNDIPLNAQGRHEAEICGQKLVHLNIDQIVASDLLRAQETAKIINMLLSVPIRFDIRLREVHWGDLCGKKIEEISDEEWKILKYNPHKIHAQSLAEAYTWIKSFFDEIDVTQNTLIVTHDGVIRMVKYLSQNPPAFDQTAYEKSTQSLEIKNTAIFLWNKADLFQPIKTS